MSLHCFILFRVENASARERERERDALHATQQTLLNGEENKYEPPNRELPRVFWGREPGREDEFDATKRFAQNRDESDIGALKD